MTIVALTPPNVSGSGPDQDGSRMKIRIPRQRIQKHFKARRVKTWQDAI
jgi:hypothetical protein